MGYGRRFKWVSVRLQCLHWGDRVGVGQEQTPSALLRQFFHLLHSPRKTPLTRHIRLWHHQDEPQELPFRHDGRGEEVQTWGVHISTVRQHRRHCLEGQQGCQRC